MTKKRFLSPPALPLALPLALALALDSAFGAASACACDVPPVDTTTLIVLLFPSMVKLPIEAAKSASCESLIGKENCGAKPGGRGTSLG